MSLQKTQIIGHIGKDAEIKDFNSNQVINFSVAVTDTWMKDGQKQSKTNWYEVYKWGNNTKVAQYITKGTQVYVEGSVTADAYTNNSGEAVGVLRLNAFNIQLLGSGKQSTSNNQTHDAKPKYDKYTAPEDEEIEDLPF